MGDALRCRSCGTGLRHTFVNLGMSPLANAYPKENEGMEPFFPLHARVCHNCFLVQLPVYESPERIFGEYAYFSSCSESWLGHAKRYADGITERLGLKQDALVVEIASNDGYLLQYLAQKGMRVLGIEPAGNVAEAARRKGVPTLAEFFGESLAGRLAAQGKRADLIVANNVLAHVPELNGFVEGIRRLLKDGGTATLEFPSLLNLMRLNQFDTIYHEHFSYLSLGVVDKLFRSRGLDVFDVEELQTHGGSLRVYACKAEDARPRTDDLRRVLRAEDDFGLNRLQTYLSFSENAHAAKRRILKTLIALKDRGKSIVAYGAAAKGCTLLRFCGIGDDFLDYAADISPYKQGKRLPGTRVPIFHPDRIGETKPDYILILPWNLKDEIMNQLRHVKAWGGKFIVPIPEIEVIG